METDPLRERLQKLVDERDLKFKTLAREAGLNEHAVRDILKGGVRSPRVDTARKLAKALDVPLAWLLGLTDEEAAHGAGRPPPPPPTGEVVLVPELDVRVGAGAGTWVEGEDQIGQWGFPAYWMRTISGRAGRGDIDVIEVIGDSMEPLLEAGDRVLVDRRQTTPSPPGIFVVFDGLATVCKRVEYLPGSEPPTVRITSANAAYSPYERTIEEANIIGRVLGCWRGM